MHKHFFLLVSITLACTFISCKEETIIYPDNVFDTIEHPAAVARACGTVFTYDNKAYILLGRKKASKPLLNDCWEFDPTNNSWKQRKDFPGEGRVFPISAVVDDQVFVGLGYNQGGVYREESYLKDFWMYDVATDEWTRKADYPMYSTNNAVSFVYNKEIYVMHGFGAFNFSPACWKYNPASDSWKQLSDFPGWSVTGAVVCTDGARFFTGTGYYVANKKDWWEYFPDTDEWKKRKRMPDTGRINAFAFAYDHRFFVATGRYFGGEHTGGHLKSDIVEYDALKDRWSKVGDLPGGGRENAISFVLINKVYLGFGESENALLNDLWSFKP